jgi:hypothetical protein
VLSVNNRIQAPTKSNKKREFDSFVARSLISIMHTYPMREGTAANRHHRFRLRTNSKRRRLAAPTWRPGCTSAWGLEFSKLRGLLLCLLGSSDHIVLLWRVGLGLLTLYRNFSKAGEARASKCERLDVEVDGVDPIRSHLKPRNQKNTTSDI